MNTPSGDDNNDTTPAEPMEGEIAEVDFQAEAAKLKDLALRARADLDNFASAPCAKRRRRFATPTTGFSKNCCP